MSAVVVPVRCHIDDLVCWWLATQGASSVTACGKRVVQAQLDFGKKDTPITCIICATLKMSR